jgi:hypothetical protein
MNPGYKVYPCIQYIGGLMPWKIVSPGIYHTEIEELKQYFHDGDIHIPLGYLTDLASVPRFLVVYNMFGGLANNASILHDWLCSDCFNLSLPQYLIDQVFLEAMRTENEPSKPWKRRVMFYAVRFAHTIGRFFFRDKRKSKYACTALLTKTNVKEQYLPIRSKP